MNNIAVRNYNGHFLKQIREIHKNAGIYQQNSISENKLYSFCLEEQKGLAYHLECLRVPLVSAISAQLWGPPKLLQGPP